MMQLYYFNAVSLSVVVFFLIVICVLAQSQEEWLQL